MNGFLSAEWRLRNPLRESAEHLLRRLIDERRTCLDSNFVGKAKREGNVPSASPHSKYPVLVAPEPRASSGLPNYWTWATIDQLAHVGTGVTPLRSQRSFFEGGTVPWVTSGALNDEFVTQPSDLVTSRALAECRLTMYPSGSLLVAMYGEGKTRGKCSELAFDSTINQAIAALVFEGSARECKAYVKYFLLNAYESMRQQASGGVQPNLNLQIIRSIVVPLPPLDEQREIVRLLDVALSDVRDQEAAIAHGLKACAAQRQNILRAAFSGQLVPQDPTDEPASELLARIRADRAASTPPTTKRVLRPRKPAVPTT
jgi:type I restriction enzyme S subunit